MASVSRARFHVPTRTRRRVVAGAMGLLATAAAFFLASGDELECGSDDEPTDFAAVGAEQAFTVPAGVTSIDVTLTGGSGADWNAGSLGGTGATVAARLSVTPGNTIYVEVGGNGRVGGRRRHLGRQHRNVRRWWRRDRPAHDFLQR